jgi:hypothetical protein
LHYHAAGLGREGGTGAPINSRDQLKQALVTLLLV